MPGPGIVVTREESAGGPLERLLRERGFRVYRWPTVRTAPAEDPAPLERALGEMAVFDWIVFTSPRAVAAVRDRTGAPPSGSGSSGAVSEATGMRPRIAAVGESTAAALREAGWRVDLVPETQTGEALVTALLRAGMGAGARVLFPASAIARDTVPDGLEEAGVVVVQVEAYRTELAPLDREACGGALDAGEITMVTFTSPSAVENLRRALGRELFERVRAGTRAVAIGPTTGEAAERAGFDTAVAASHSLEGLADRAAGLAAHLRMEEG